eukprot:1898444-Rhodomonas_salina.1
MPHGRGPQRAQHRGPGKAAGSAKHSSPQPWGGKVLLLVLVVPVATQVPGTDVHVIHVREEAHKLSSFRFGARSYIVMWLAVTNADPAVRLTIMTDSMNVINALQAWSRR